MSQKKVVVNFAPDGSSEIDAQGFQGQSCSLATRELELALAGNMNNVEDKKKPDWFAKTAGTQKQSN